MDTIKANFQKISEQARQDHAKVEMLIAGGETISIGFSKKKLESFESTQSQVAGLRVIAGAKQGYAYTENLSEESLLRTYREALNNAQTVRAANNTEVPMVKPQPVQAMDGLFKPQEVPMEQKIAVARDLEEKCLSKDARIQSVPYSGFSDSLSFKRILNSEGLDQEFKQNYYSGYVYPLAKEGDSTKTSGEGFFVRSFGDIKVDEVVDEGVRKALANLGAQKLSTGKYAVVIDRSQFPMILQMLSSYLSAKTVHQGKSLLEGKLGQKIVSEKFQLVDNPFEITGSAVRPFDDEGAPSQKTVLFENGVLKNFLTNLEYAQKMKLPHTASASRSPASELDISPSNLVMAKGSADFSELVRRYDKVLHITEFEAGLHSSFKSSTGDISMPSSGFLYENGKCVGPVEQFVVAGNVLELLQNIEELGNEYNKPGSSKICPDVLVKPMSVAGA
ncbi:MAG: TldD/PmbA family protein [Bdellovibrio sp.]|nr:TldD/PmbA family protein [Bdellovibrio sp.]